MDLYHVKLASVLIIFIFLFGCGNEYRAPEKPEDIPDDAVYAWNGYSGQWVKCEVTAPSSLTCDTFNMSEREFDRRNYYTLCMNLEFLDQPKRTPAIPADIGDISAYLNEVIFFHSKPFEYIGSQPRSSERVQNITALAQQAFSEYGVSEDCEPIGSLVVLRREGAHLH